MPKPQDIFQLAQQEAVRVTASPQAWQSFLYTAAQNYHTTYLNQLLIHAQRPDAAACASMEYWNTKANRLVMRGSRSITVLQRRQGVAVTKPVFAIGDTTLLSQTHTGGPWEVTDTTRPLLLQGKSDDWLAAQAQDGVSNDADRARVCWNAMWQTVRCNGRSLTSRCSSCRHWSHRVLSTWHGYESDCRCGARISRLFKASASSTPIKFHCVWAAICRPPQNRC